MSSFCERLNDLQTKSGVLKRDIAKIVDVSVMAYYRYETGDRNPPLPTLIALADYFGVSIDYLVGRTDNPEVNK